MNTNLKTGARCHLGVINQEPVAFVASVILPHAIIENMLRIHRAVVLPDYQGIGIGIKMMNWVASYLKHHNRVAITTSTPQILHAFKKMPDWIMTHFGRKGRHMGLSAMTGSGNRITSSWEFVGKAKDEKLGEFYV